MGFTQGMLSGKTSQVPLVATKVEILEQSLKKSQRPKFQYLDLDDGPNPEWLEGGGSEIAWRTLDAQYWGVPQRRKRIFLVADFRGRCAGEILFEREGMFGDSSESGEAREEVAASVGDGVEATSRIGYAMQAYGEYSDTGKSSTLKQRDYKDATDLVVCFEPGAMSRLGGHAWEDRCGTLRADMGDNQTCVMTMASRQISQNIGHDVAMPLMESDYKEPQVVCHPVILENHPADSRVKVDDTGTVQTLTSRMGTGGGNVPMLMHPTYSFSSGNSAEARSIGFAKEVAPTLKGCAGGNMVPAIAFTTNQRDEVRDLGDKSSTVQAQPGMKQQTFVAQPTFAIQSGTMPNKSQNGLGVSGGPMYTLDTRADHAIAYPIAFDGRQDPISGPLPGALGASLPQAQCVAVDVRNLNETEELSGTLQSKNSGGYSLNYQNPIRIGYRVRRLTPTECLRLQGFPDKWLDIEGASDSAKYKAVGNSVAIPCVEFIFSQIVKILSKMKERFY